MKLWLIRPVEGRKEWYRKYDVALGFVVRAESEEDARSMIRKPFGAGDEGEEVWADPEKTTCTELHSSGPPEIIIVDFHAG